MKNKHVGLLIVGMAVIFLFIVISFNMALETIVNTTCEHGEMCPMQVTLRTQEIVSYSLIALLIVLGGIVFFFMREEQPQNIVNKKLENLDEDERKIMNIVAREEGSVYQSDLVKETGLSKVMVTRLLDKLEGKGFIERKRRGMTNIVVRK